MQWNDAYMKSDIHVPADSEFFFMQSNGSVISVVEAYRRGKGMPLLTKKYATWSSSSGLQVLEASDKYERRSLTGVKIRVASIHV